jgi:hypothetical protein
MPREGGAIHSLVIAGRKREVRLGAIPSLVIAGLDPAIQLFCERMDARIKSAHDE